MFFSIILSFVAFWQITLEKVLFKSHSQTFNYRGINEIIIKIRINNFSLKFIIKIRIKSNKFKVEFLIRFLNSTSNLLLKLKILIIKIIENLLLK